MKLLLLLCVGNFLLLDLLFTQDNWFDKRAEVGEFIISFPKYPVYNSKSSHEWYAKDKNDQVTYYMSYNEFPANVELTIATLEKHLMPSLMEGDIQVSLKHISYAGLPGIEFLYKTRNSPSMYMKGRAIIRNQRLYVLQIHYYHSNLVYFEKYANSLKFI